MSSFTNIINDSSLKTKESDSDNDKNKGETSAPVEKTYTIHDYQKIKFFLSDKYINIEQPHFYWVNNGLFVKQDSFTTCRYCIKFYHYTTEIDSSMTDGFDNDMYHIVTDMLNNIWPLLLVPKSAYASKYNKKVYYNHPEMSGVTLHLYDAVRKKITKEPIRTLQEFKSAILFIEHQKQVPLDDSVSLVYRKGYMNETFHFILQETPKAEKARLDLMVFKLDEYNNESCCTVM